MAKGKRRNTNSKFLTELAQYNEEVLFPALEARFVTKDEFKEFKDEMYSFKDEMYSFKNEMYSFKNEMYSFKDEMYAFKAEMYEFKDEMYAFRDRMDKFRDESLTNQDAILKKLDILIEEKQVADYQWEKTKQLLMFLTKRLKDSEILSDKDLAIIKSMEVF